MRNLDLSQSELTRGIIGAIGSLDAYKLPDAKGFQSLVDYLLDEDEETRQRFRDQVLSTKVEHFRAFADVLDQARTQGRVVVMGSQDALRAVNEMCDKWLAIQKVL